MDVQATMDRAYAICEAKGWRRDWVEGGVALHLEASEFIESLRGKGGDPADEAGDVLFVILSMMKGNGITLDAAMAATNRKMSAIEAGTYKNGVH